MAQLILSFPESIVLEEALSEPAFLVQFAATAESFQNLRPVVLHEIILASTSLNYCAFELLDSLVV